MPVTRRADGERQVLGASAVLASTAVSTSRQRYSRGATRPASARFPARCRTHVPKLGIVSLGRVFRAHVLQGGKRLHDAKKAGQARDRNGEIFGNSSSWLPRPRQHEQAHYYFSNNMVVI